MGWWKRTKDWFSDAFSGAKSRVRALYDELPPVSELVSELDAESLLVAVDRAVALEPDDSKILRATVKIANLLDFIAPVSGIGSDKERALLAKLRGVANWIGWADEKFDTFVGDTVRPALVKYIEAKKKAA